MQSNFCDFLSYSKRVQKSALRNLLLGFVFVFSSSIPGWTNVLDGTTVSGYLVMSGSGSDQNWWDPHSPSPQDPLYVPAPYLNHSGSTTIVISETLPELGWCACAPGGTHTSVVADFTDTGLKVTSFSDFSLQFGWIQTFTDTAFSGLSITKTLDQYPYTNLSGGLTPDNGVTAALNGDVLTLTWTGLTTGGGPFEADFRFSNASAAPEPSTWAMMLLGFAGVSFMA